jgi:hypothetical protein
VFEGPVDGKEALMDKLSGTRKLLHKVINIGLFVVNSFFVSSLREVKSKHNGDVMSASYTKARIRIL